MDHPPDHGLLATELLAKLRDATDKAVEKHKVDCYIALSWIGLVTAMSIVAAIVVGLVGSPL